MWSTLVTSIMFKKRSDFLKANFCSLCLPLSAQNDILIHLQIFSIGSDLVLQILYWKQQRMPNSTFVIFNCGMQLSLGWDSYMAGQGIMTEVWGQDNDVCLG